MDGVTKVYSHAPSAAAFVEGGLQDACDDGCSICLETFSESNPSMMTNCKHEFHIQCILEWCQRSSQCPMCWQPISLKDATSQELFETVERERSFRVNQSHTTTIFRRSALEDFGLRHLPIDPDDASLEERIFQRLTAAAMGRERSITRREAHQGSSGAQGRPQFLVFSAHPNTSIGSVSAHRGDNDTVPAIISANPSASLATPEKEASGQTSHISAGQADQVAGLPSRNFVIAANMPDLSYSRSSPLQFAPVDQDRAEPSDIHSLAETLKSRLNAVSMRYRESFSRSTQEWKEKLFTRSTSVADIGSDVRREFNAGIATVSRMFERLDVREPTQSTSSSTPHSMQSHSVTEPSYENITEMHSSILPNDSNISTSSAANSHPV